MEYSEEDNEIAEDRRMALEEARLADQEEQESVVSQPTEPKESAIDFLADLPYIFAIIVAVAKDLSDFIGIGSLPLIGTLVTLMALCLLSLLVFLAKPADFLKNFGVLFGGTAVDMIPVLNLFPALTAAAIYVYGKKIIGIILKNKGIGAKMINKRTSVTKS